jgi:hypothetical protein
MVSVISYWKITSSTLVTKIQNYTSQSSLSNTHICIVYTGDGCWCDIFPLECFYYHTKSDVMTNSRALVRKKLLILFIKFEITTEKCGYSQME